MKKYAVFGIGYIGKWFISEIGSENIGIIIDNNADLCGKHWSGIEIVSLRQYLKLQRDYEVVIAVSKNREDIVFQLRECHIENVSFYSNVWLRHKLKNHDMRAKTIFLLNTHAYTNGGDRLITYAQKVYLRECFAEYETVTVPSFLCGKDCAALHPWVKKEDILLVSGGGYLGNLWMENGEQNVRAIAEEFLENRVVILPQSLHFSADEDGETEKIRSELSYRKNKNLIICLRDQVSFAAAKMLYTKNRCEFIPDMTFFLSFPEGGDRRGIRTCLREDKERIVSPARERLISYMESKNIFYTAFQMEIPELVSEKEADRLILEKAEIIGSSKLVVTDRLHCMMLCLLTGTPCIVFDNISGKVRGTYELCKNHSYIRYAENEQQAIEHLNYFHKTKERYCYDRQTMYIWFDRLKQLILGE